MLYSCTCRYISRCVLIEFPPPCLDISMTSYAQLPDLIARSGSAVGSIIGLGKKFFEVGIGEVDSFVLLKVRGLLNSSIVPRVLPSYAVLIWFTLKVSNTL